MAFIPRLPTWHNNVLVWKYDPDTDSFTEDEEPLLGQVYTQLRNQDDSTRGTLYFEYPKEDDRLRDLADYEDVGKADLVVIDFPSPAPRSVAYLVRDVQPRWLGFVNEHLMATLERITDDTFDTWVDPPDPPPDPPENVTVSLTMSNIACESCNDIAGDTICPISVSSPPTFVWQEFVAFTCYAGNSFVLVVVVYDSTTGDIDCTITSVPDGIIRAEYTANYPDWDFTTATLDRISGEAVQCGWPALLSVAGS